MSAEAGELVYDVAIFSTAPSQSEVPAGRVYFVFLTMWHTIRSLGGLATAQGFWRRSWARLRFGRPREVCSGVRYP